MDSKVLFFILVTFVYLANAVPVQQKEVEAVVPNDQIVKSEVAPEKNDLETAEHHYHGYGGYGGYGHHHHHHGYGYGGYPYYGGYGGYPYYGGYGGYGGYPYYGGGFGGLLGGLFF